MDDYESGDEHELPFPKNPINLRVESKNTMESAFRIDSSDQQMICKEWL